MCRYILTISFTLLFNFFSQAQPHTFYLLGDAGQPYVSGDSALQQLLQKQFNSLTPSTTIFLGDNIYPVGMPDKDDVGRKRAESILQDQIKLLADLNTETYFIPGNHEWKEGRGDGLHQVYNQQVWFDSLQNPRVHFLPND